MSSARLIIKGAKSHTCAACRSPIAEGDSSMLVHRRGHSWRLCRACAPETLGGYPIVWGRACEWRISGVRTAESDERGSAQGEEHLTWGRYAWPWEGSGWDKPPVTPEQREATEQQERAHYEAFLQAAQQQDCEWAKDNAAAESARLERCLDLCNLVCELAAGHATSADGHDCDNLETAAKALIPDIVTSFDLHARDRGLSVEDAAKLLLQIAWESARKGYEAGFRTGARAQSVRPTHPTQHGRLTALRDLV